MTNRFLLKQFAGGSEHNGVFGSFQSGSKELSSDPAEIQKLDAWDSGWCDAVSSGSRLPRLEEMQGLQYVLCKAVKELYSEGIPLWAAGETYYRHSIVSFVNEGVPSLYYNKTGAYTDADPASDTQNWLMFLDTGASYADIDASNFSVSGKSFLSGLGMPSSRAIDVTLGASGARYTAPGNGYFTAYNANSANGAVRFVNITKGIGMNSPAVQNFSDGIAFVPAKKNDIVDMFYTGTFNTSGNGWFRFVYVEGEQNV